MFGVGRLLHQTEDEDDNIEEDDEDEVDVDIKPESPSDEITRSNTKTQFANFSGFIKVTNIFAIFHQSFCSVVTVGEENTGEGKQ